MRKKKNITILNVGDEVDYDSFKKLNKEKRFIASQGFEYRSAGYSEFLNGGMPEIPTKKAAIFFFFPFEYWNQHIEHRAYRGMYGNKHFYKKFEHFCKMLSEMVKKQLSGKEVILIDDPSLFLLGRDKAKVMGKLSGGKVPVPRRYRTRKIGDIEKLLGKGHKLYIKPRCGSMGKGITFLQSGDWQTNFGFKNNKIISRKSDLGWKFHDVTGKKFFLEKLLKQNIYIEEGIEPFNIKGDKVDLRIYGFYDKIIYIYPRRNKIDEVTTNISQGGKGDPSLLRVIPKRMVAQAKKTALKGMKALGLYFAGIDVVIDSSLKETYIVDVNMFPGFPKRRTYNLSRRMITELKRLNHTGKLCFKKI